MTGLDNIALLMKRLGVTLSTIASRKSSPWRPSVRRSKKTDTTDCTSGNGVAFVGNSARTGLGWVSDPVSLGGYPVLPGPGSNSCSCVLCGIFQLQPWLPSIPQGAFGSRWRQGLVAVSDPTSCSRVRAARSVKQGDAYASSGRRV